MLPSKYLNKHKAQKTETELQPLSSRTVASLADFSLEELERWWVGGMGVGGREKLSQSHFLKCKERLLQNFQDKFKITK